MIRRGESIDTFLVVKMLQERRKRNMEGITQKAEKAWKKWLRRRGL